MDSFSVQVMSDLTARWDPYRRNNSVTFPATAPYLALLGNIGHVARFPDDGLFSFLEELLQRYEIVFFVLGSQEPQGTSFRAAKENIRRFEAEANKRSSPGKFVFLDQTRYDISDDTTILGCTLFSRIPDEQKVPIGEFFDFRSTSGWTPDDHNAAHKSDLAWLNQQVFSMAANEPRRRVIIFTHHCPSIDPTWAVSPLANRGKYATAFASDLRLQVCWMSRTVRMWAFGHTGVNCDLTINGKRVVTNQQRNLINPDPSFNPEKTVPLRFAD